MTKIRSPTRHCDDRPLGVLTHSEEPEAFRMTLKNSFCSILEYRGIKESKGVCGCAQEKHAFRPKCNLLRDTSPLYGQ